MTEEEAFGLAYVTQVDDPSDPEIEMAAELYAKVGDLLEKWGIVKEFSKELKIYSAGWYSYLDIIKGWDGFFECQGIRVGLDVKGGPEQALFGEVRVSKFQQPKRSLDRNKYMDWLMDMAMPAAEEISAKLRISKEAA